MSCWKKTEEAGGRIKKIDTSFRQNKQNKDNSLKICY